MKVVVGQGSCGIATGAKKTVAALEKLIAEKGLNVDQPRNLAKSVTVE